MEKYAWRKIFNQQWVTYSKINRRKHSEKHQRLLRMQSNTTTQENVLSDTNTQDQPKALEPLLSLIICQNIMWAYQFSEGVQSHRWCWIWFPFSVKQGHSYYKSFAIYFNLLITSVNSIWLLRIFQCSVDVLV